MIKKFFQKKAHLHIIKSYDIATGISEQENFVPLTAFKFKCILCGESIDDITDSGLTQLENGHKRENVFNWVFKNK